MVLTREVLTPTPSTPSRSGRLMAPGMPPLAPDTSTLFLFILGSPSILSPACRFVPAVGTIVIFPPVDGPKYAASSLGFLRG